MSNRERILQTLRASNEPLDDDELAEATGIHLRQTVNQICRELQASGQIVRAPGEHGRS
jgi:DNA-binding IclR family transcriptional regulator